VFKKDILAEKVALISGGGTGINFGIAKELGLHGAKVVIMGRRKEVLDKAVEQLATHGIQSLGVQGDVRKFADCQRIVETAISKFGKLDILVNGAAGNFLSAAEDLSANGFKTVLEIDTIGTFHMSKAAFPALKERGGVIVNISATLYYAASHFQIHASAAKAGVDSITRSLALEWGKYGIRVVGIAPGPIADTEGLFRLTGEGADNGLLDSTLKTVPLRRLGKIVDIAQVAVFLSSSAASYITGDVLVVDGGQFVYTPPFVPIEVYEAMVASRKAKL